MVEIKNAEVYFPAELNENSFKSRDDYLKNVSVVFDMKGNGCFMPEFQRYEKTSNCGIVMSQSTMHSVKKLMETDGFDPFTKYVTPETRKLVRQYYEKWRILQTALDAREKECSDARNGLKRDTYIALMTLLHNLPRGLELWLTVTSSYFQLKTQVIQRTGHKQAEDWGTFVKFCHSLPRFRELCGLAGSEWNVENRFPVLKLLGNGC